MIIDGAPLCRIGPDESSAQCGLCQQFAQFDAWPRLAKLSDEASSMLPAAGSTVHS